VAECEAPEFDRHIFFDRYLMALQQSAIHTGISTANAGQ
jgi:hypothetical protein